MIKFESARRKVARKLANLARNASMKVRFSFVYDENFQKT